ncbi:uncharacterized protein FA14DRAFT_153860 [Meira miltonrushii]|uniref:Pal1-domain-containing protein n=1 Tax=Meira miltonrushii TaxID=1280837 RepID=A0A316VLU7_9BASI|nr:uncharacterized protein FA14DRAFT_153860 [Meira miltonrushii]PWN38536.1 hypothetical protein FA14DRAFT_153860 [Meira miltonrushii]
MQLSLFHHLLHLFLLLSVVQCMRPAHQQDSPTHQSSSRQATGGQAPTALSASEPNSQQAGHPVHPVDVSTGRMKPVTGPGSPRFGRAYHNIRTSPGGAKLKGVSHTGILANPNSEFDFPKMTVTRGNKESAVISLFHHPRHPPGDGPYQYMQRQQPDTTVDKADRAKTYPLGFRKHEPGSEDDHRTRSRLDSMSSDQTHPRAAISYRVGADQRVKHKRPRVDVDAGKYHGHLLTFVFGPESPPKHGTQGQSSANTGHQQGGHGDPLAHDFTQTYASGQGLFRAHSPDRGENSKRRRVD